MYVLGVLGREHDALERVTNHLVDRLSARGRVGVVRYDATIADGTAATLRESGLTAGGEVTYDLGADGDWAACGTGMSVEDALNALAPRCEYALVLGVPTLSAPSVVIGEDEADAVDVLERVSSSGDLDADAVVTALEDTEPYETLESLVVRVKRDDATDLAGAIATFTGRVRAKESPDDVRTEYLEFEKYDDIADERMETIEAELEARDSVYRVELHHRTGVVRDGDDIVFVVVLAGHRDEAFRTVEDGINRLKAEVPLFKKEVTVEDEFWVHDRP